MAMAMIGLAAAAPAAAQTAEEQAEAEALYAQALELMKAGKYAEACPKLERSQRLDAGTGTLLYLATCYEKRGQIASAWATFLAAEAQARHSGDDRQAIARRRAAQLAPRLPRLTLRLAAGAAPIPAIVRDGKPVDPATLGTAVPLDPGRHVIEARADGFRTWTTTLELAEASAKTVEIPPLVAEPPAPAPVERPQPVGGLAAPAPAPARAERPAIATVTGGALLGLGVLGLGAAGYQAWRVEDRKHLAVERGACDPDFATCSSDGQRLLADARRARLWAIVAGAGGALAISGGIAALVAWRASPEAAPPVEVALTGDGVIVTAAGSF